MGLCFFTSRRRHTRCSRDWSSDVCSSDLCNDGHQPQDGQSLQHKQLFHLFAQLIGREPELTPLACHIYLKRSEERRVGKECRSRWSTSDEHLNSTHSSRAPRSEQ